MKLTQLQNQKVEQIYEMFAKGEKLVEFSAPTGSGKTLMASHLIGKMIARMNEKFIFIIATLSSAELPKFFEKKIEQYKKDLENSEFEVRHYQSPSSSDKGAKDMQCKIVPIKNMVYIFGKSTFGKNRIYTEQGVIENFIDECKNENYKIVYIRDEAHIGGSVDSEARNFENLMGQKADFVLKMTATFKHNAKRVKISEDELRGENNNGVYLLKERAVDLREGQNLLDEEIIDKAIEKFAEIKKDYENLDSQKGVKIRPAMLVQVDNEPSGDDEKKRWSETLKILKEKLDGANLSWVVYFGDKVEFSHADNDLDKKNLLQKISKIDDSTDCIIFKVGPATGWDIPRACMLVRLRNVCSSALNLQTLGRIKRNPYPKLEFNEITNKYFVFDNVQKQKEYVQIDYEVKDDFKNVPIVKVELKAQNGSASEQKTNEQIEKFIEQIKADEIKRKIKDVFKDDAYQTQSVQIKNVFLLLKHIAILKQNLGDCATSDFLKKVVDKYCTFGLNDFQARAVLLESYANAIKESYKKCMEYKYKWQTSIENLDPQSYYTQTSKDDFADLINAEQYFFEIRKNGSKADEVNLDSENEKPIFKQLQKSCKNSVKIWCKNQRSGNMYIQYLDDDGQRRKSYPDFVMKFENGYFVYIEVKGYGENDVDGAKTQNLKREYERYFGERAKNSINALPEITNIDNNAKLVILLARVRENQINDLKPFYDKNDENLKNIQNAGNDLSEVLKIIKNVKSN